MPVATLPRSAASCSTWADTAAPANLICEQIGRWHDAEHADFAISWGSLTYDGRRCDRCGGPVTADDLAGAAAR